MRFSLDLSLSFGMCILKESFGTEPTSTRMGGSGRFALVSCRMISVFLRFSLDVGASFRMGVLKESFVTEPVSTSLGSSGHFAKISCFRFDLG